MLGSINQIGNEIDEFVTGALRNNLLGLPLDLAALNIARGRDTGVAPLNLLRNEILPSSNRGTDDTTLKPYASWDEFGQFLKHAGLADQFRRRLRHPCQSITRRDHARRQARGGARPGRRMAVDPAARPRCGFDQDAYDFMHSLGAYANDVTNPLAVHADWSTGSITGLDTVDLWIGGLAEKQNLFGGLLGSTFNFIFENQLEAMQDGDRLYYLPRIEGMHFGTEIETNTFAELIMQNTGTQHLQCQHLPDAGICRSRPARSPTIRRPGCATRSTGALLVERLTNEYVERCSSMASTTPTTPRSTSSATTTSSATPWCWAAPRATTC